MRAIVTKQNADGSFDEVGMNNRTVLGPYRRTNFIQKRAREYAHNKPHRIEYFVDSILVDKPLSVEIVK